jgi:heptosyltransferase-2
MKKTVPLDTLRPRRILVRGVNWLGDAVMSAPALQRLRERFPDAHITLLCPEKLRDLWQFHPALSKIISFGPHDSVFTTAAQLRRGCFDLVLVFPNSPRSALESYFAHIPHRIGYSRSWRNLFLTHPLPPRPGAVKMRQRPVSEIKKLVADLKNQRREEFPLSAHHMHEYLNLVAALGANPEPLAPVLEVGEQEIEHVRTKFSLPDSDLPIFGVNPGAEYGPAKRWPADRFAATVSHLQELTHGTWIVFGGPNDVALAKQIVDSIGSTAQPILNLAGETSLRELMALLKISRVLLTNDTGPMHVAAALGTPVVVPFGSTSPELTGPGDPAETRHQLLKSSVPCAPCFRRQCPIDFRCMNGLSVEKVAQAFMAAVNPPPAAVAA